MGIPVYKTDGKIIIWEDFITLNTQVFISSCISRITETTDRFWQKNNNTKTKNHTLESVPKMAMQSGGKSESQVFLRLIFFCG